MQLTEKDLPELAGWQVVKLARNLVSAGSVIEAKVTMGEARPWHFKGVVVEGRRRHIAGLTVNSLSEAENHCNCLASRRDGKICEHSIAVALVGLDQECSVNAAKPLDSTEGQCVTEDVIAEFFWFPVPLFDYALIDQRSNFPLQFCRTGKISSIDRDIKNDVLATYSRLGIALQGESKRIDLNKSDFLQLMTAFKGGVWPDNHIDGNSKQWPQTRVSSIPARIPITATEIPDNPGKARIELPEMTGSLLLFDGIDCWILRESDHLSIPTNVLELPVLCREVFAPLLQDSPTSNSLEVEISWLRNELPNLTDVFHMECSGQLNELLRITPGIPEVSLKLEGSLRQLDISLSFIYKPGESANPAFVSKAFKLFQTGDWNQSKSPNDGQTECFLGKLKGEENILDFYAGNLDRVMSAGEWHVEIGPRFAEITKNIDKVRPRIAEVGQGNDWLSFDLEFASSSGQCIPEKEIRRLLSTGSSRVRLPGGGCAAFDSAEVGGLFDALSDAEADHEINHPSRRKVRSIYKLFFETYISEPSESSTYIPPPQCFRGELRDYQQSGLAWLYSRSSMKHGAILADEMGLGKTVQILALIALLQDNPEIDNDNDRGENASNTCIVVCPTSLIFNWKQEISRFLPSKRVIVLHGTGRAIRFKEMQESDIVITSYGALARDITKYPELIFQLVVADEASCLKNPRTQVAKTLSMISSHSRIALTGTPIENSVQDLWSIMNFANPGYLEGSDMFISRYGSGKPDQMKRLHRRISPFMLRRTKAEVASELPAKIERVIYCELSPDQRSNYEQLLRFGQNKFKNLHKALSDSSARMEMLLLLLRLRQVCCDLRLLDGPINRKSHSNTTTEDESAISLNDSDANLRYEDALSWVPSAKMLALNELINGVLETGGRVLIFSQFVSMLRLIRMHLDSKGLKYCYLDGSQSPTQRSQQVEAFQSEESQIPIFLMSLKAGGYGLTLTRADTVVHFDPWWNPAVEAQATDRAHRIGQERTVTSYKFIVTGTVEEKILQLQERKRHMADVALDDEAPLMQTLSGEDIEFILS